MTNITELVQREKFEAWREREYKHLESSKYTDAVPHIKYGFWMAYQAGGAELVEALEKAQQRIAELEEAEQKLCAANVTLDARAELAERQLADLESLSVTVKLPDLRQVVSGDRYVWSDGVFNYSQDVKAELTAKGIKWEAE